MISGSKSVDDDDYNDKTVFDNQRYSQNSHPIGSLSLDQVVSEVDIVSRRGRPPKVKRSGRPRKASGKF